MPEAPGIGERLAAARARRAWSREQLAVASGVSWSGITQIETGRRRNVRPATLSALAAPLGVTTDHLINGRLVESMLDHRALLYSSNDEFADATVPFLREGMERGEGLLAVTSAERIALIREELGADAELVDFIASDAFYTGPAAALNGYGKYVEERLELGHPWVRVVGEPVWAGRSAAETLMWTRYESIFNLVFGGSPVTVICPYDERVLDAEIVREANRTHPKAIRSGKLSPCPGYADPAEFVLGG